MEIQLNNRKQVSAEASVSFCLPMMGAAYGIKERAFHIHKKRTLKMQYDVLNNA